MKANLYIVFIGIILSMVGCQNVAKKEKINDTDPLLKLKNGNERFLKGTFINNRSTNLLNKLSKGQHPFAVVISCSDSRISPNVLFDTDLGDLFIIRTAGNIIGEVDLASVEYAVEHLDTELVVVLGHSNCGAIHAFLNHKKVHGHIQTLIDSLNNEPEEQALMKLNDKNPTHYERNNVIHQANYLLKNSKIIQAKVDSGKIKIVKAFLDTKTGKITF